MSEFSVWGAITYAVNAVRERPDAAAKLILFPVLVVFVARLAQNAVALGAPEVFQALLMTPFLLVMLIGVPIGWLRFLVLVETRPARLWPNWSEAWIVVAGIVLVHALGVMAVIPFFLAGIAISMLGNEIGTGGAMLGMAVALLSYIAYPVVMSRLLPSIGLGLLRHRLLAVVSWGATRHIRFKLLAAWGAWLGFSLCVIGIATGARGFFPVPSLTVWMQEIGFVTLGACFSILLAVASGIVADTTLYLVEREPGIGRMASDGGAD